MNIITRILPKRRSPLCRVGGCLLGLLLLACSENDHATYSGSDCIYFCQTTQQDSMQYSFAAGLTHRDTVRIPVRIIGAAAQHDRQIAYVVAPTSTARADVHYRLLRQPALLPAGQVQTTIDVEVSDADPALQQGRVELHLTLAANEAFQAGYPDRQQARLIITGLLVKPSYWEMPLSLYFGKYSRAKHRLCIQVMGHDFPDRFDEADISRYIAYGRLVYASLLRNPLYDEDTGQTVTADWAPI